jgi:hypothetical protein
MRCDEKADEGMGHAVGGHRPLYMFTGDCVLRTRNVFMMLPPHLMTLYE